MFKLIVILGNKQTYIKVTLHTYRSTNPSNNVEDAVAKRRRKKRKEVETKAEDVENYKGNQSIEELVSFIGGQNVSNKKTKKLTEASEDIPSKTQKSNKKNKDKKQKPLLSGSHSLDEGPEVKGGTSAQSVTSSSDGGSENNMGNSSVRPESVVDKPVENGDIDGLCVKNEKLDLLKENDKRISVEKVKGDLSDESVEAFISVNCKEIYKDKEKISTNNKRDAVNACVVIENNKEKSEKPVKTSKIEKLEMPVSKSEDCMKVNNVENSISVKQKNAKNKKSKPISPTVKVESEADAGVGDVISSPVLSSLISTDSKFIFTDLDVPHVPKEDEFTVVSKKKKKLQKETQSSQNHFLSSGNGGSGGNSKAKRFEEKRGGNNSSHSFTKTTSAQASHQVTTADSEKHTRDLSPSSFPALESRKGKHDGRRNSTGDVPIPTGLKSQDDSDLESVKSLPATQGSQKMDLALSHRLTYAMAAHSVPSKPVDSGDSLSLDIPESEHDHKKAVWKGSPTERRHSIGSSPDVVNKITGLNISSAAAMVKAGSQEHIVAEMALKAESSGANTRKLNPWGKVEKSETAEKSDTEHVIEKENSPSEISTSDAKVLITQPVQSLSVSKNTESGSVSQSQLISATKATTTNKQVDSVHKDTETRNSSSLPSKNHSVNSSNAQKHESSKQSSKSSNGSNSKKQKSVIFLDKRVEEAPGNLGISFGFEEDSVDKVAESDSTVAIQLDPTADKTEVSSDPNPVHISDNSFMCESYIEPSVLVGNIEESSSSHNSSSLSVISNNGNASKETKSNVITDANNSDPVNKTQIVRMNGIVTRSQGQGIDLTSGKSELVKDNVSNLTEDKVNLRNSESSVEVTEHIEGEVVYYGEYVESGSKNISIPSARNGPRMYCGRVCYKEMEEQKGGFNIMDAVSFLARGWYD